MKISSTEENYLKAIFHLCEESQKNVTSTNTLAADLDIRPASVSAMLKKLKEKKLINYEKYGDVKLATLGKEIAVGIIRKHRLWEVFLVDTLGFTWDEVHEVAEQLEHIKSTKLIDKLDAFLLYPKLDPHGDPIPSAKGEIKKINRIRLNEACAGEKYEIVGVSDTSSQLLQFLIKQNIGLGTKIEVIHIHELDASALVQLSNGKRITITLEAAKSIQVI